MPPGNWSGPCGKGSGRRPPRARSGTSASSWRQLRVDDRVSEQELAFTREKLDLPGNRRPFAAPQPVAEDAPALDRLAALLGRSVTA